MRSVLGDAESDGIAPENGAKIADGVEKTLATDHRPAVGLLLRTLRAESEYGLYDAIGRARSYAVRDGKLVIGVDGGTEPLLAARDKLDGILRETGLTVEIVEDLSPETVRERALDALRELSGGKLTVL